MFDVLRYTKELEESGWTEAQANSLIKVVSSIMDKNFSTKSDFLKLEHQLDGLQKDMRGMERDLRKDIENIDQSLRKEIQNVDQSLRKEIASLGDKLTIRLSAVMVVLVSAMYTLQRL